MFLLGYTREPIDSVHYDPRLAYSLHLALGEDGVSFEGLNHDSGVLFALATENEDGSLNPMSLKNPFLFPMRDGGYGVLAVRIPADGGDDESSRGSVLFWTSKDLLSYREVGLLGLCEAYVESVFCYEYEGEPYLFWEDRDGKMSAAAVDFDRLSVTPIRLNDALELFCREKKDALSRVLSQIQTSGMQGTVPHCVLEIPDETATRLRCKLTPPVNNSIRFPARVEASSREAFLQMTAEAGYTDGSVLQKRIDWELSGVDFAKPGTYPVKGKVHQEHFPFPVAFNRADPCVCYWGGKYYFIATNDADNNHTLYVRESDTMEGLITAPEHLILDSVTHEGIGNLLWAPEFHEINGRLYIFHAATPGEFFREESHIMELREGGNPICKEDWSAPRRIVRMDGSELCEAGKVISLDMTCFSWEGEWYVVWSQRQFIPKDLGAWLYIAKLNPEKPWMLAGEPVVLSKPDYGWGNNHTFVEEGPFALLGDGKLFVTFSAAAVDSSYVVSYLEIEAGKDLLVRENWRKNNYPILTSRSVEGEYGTGHNAYVIDEFGTTWNTYHARPGAEGVRSSGIRRVFFDIDGCPVLDVTEEMDVKPEFRTVETVLVVKRNDCRFE